MSEFPVGDAVPPAPVPGAPVARRFVGKVAFVTGAARGQGRAEAVRLAAEGADIIALDINRSLATTRYPGPTPADLAETVALVEKLGRRIVAVEADVRDYDAVRNAVTEGVSTLGRLDVVIANAGATTAAHCWEIEAEQWQEAIDVNLTGAFHTAKAALRVLLHQGSGGSIVFTSSVAGLRGAPFLASYSAAKHGVVGLATSLANELAPYRIRVNSVHPNGVDTELKVHELFALLDANPYARPYYTGSLPETISESEDIAAAVAWLASDEARHVTGIQLAVDRGRLSR
ncbi:mycofactocin-coupled SDR family oxidoreductase [Amycolatopsis sp.]|uniref:mycofactocin-coupled SDR family oxidoreductase n=1 Tax=Amycolatopsis sp. TaxID=37632 RepID=UPI002BC48FAF|nr:mycofactocin-coupled SDR family oxidoreductase [Amycolatopsis sp.]HVV10477.1 mycofactocin-coupled SDR family oxidoreductase [Amycolatopsis sp.]